MKNKLWYQIIFLTIVVAGCGGLLSYVNGKTAPVINMVSKVEEDFARKLLVLPDKIDLTKLQTDKLYAYYQPLYKKFDLPKTKTEFLKYKPAPEMKEAFLVYLGRDYSLTVFYKMKNFNKYKPYLKKVLDKIQRTKVLDINDFKDNKHIFILFKSAFANAVKFKKYLVGMSGSIKGKVFTNVRDNEFKAQTGENVKLINEETVLLDDGKTKEKVKQLYLAYLGDKPFAIVFKAMPVGYGGKIPTLVAIDRNGTVLGIKILSQSETPGLGARCVEVKPGDIEPWFQKQFKGVPLSKLYLKEKDEKKGVIDKITASTITSRGVTKGIREAIKQLLPYVKEVMR